MYPNDDDCHWCNSLGIEVEAKRPRLSLSRNNAGRLFIGLDEYDEDGYAKRSCVLSDAGTHTADSVMRRRFADMARLMGDNVTVVDES